MGLFDFGKAKKAATSVAAGMAGPNIEDPGWARDKTNRFHRLITLDPEEEGLDRKGGVIAAWHAGVRPKWLHFTVSEDMASTFHRLGRERDIMEYEINGGIFVSWTFVMPDYRAGVVKFLDESMKPLVPNPSAYGPKTEAIPVYAPGAEPKK